MQVSSTRGTTGSAGPAGPAGTVGVVGSGDLARVVATALAEAGPVRGTSGGTSLVDLARACNTVVLALPTAEESEQAVAELAPAAPGLILIDLAVLDPADTARIAGLALSLGSLYVDAPVTGPLEQVGRWRVEVGGPVEAYDALARVLAPLASEVVGRGRPSPL